MSSLRAEVGGRPVAPAPSPNHNARPAPPRLIVLHYTGMQTAAGALARLRAARRKVSCHYLIDEDGRVFALVPEERRAWHAGAGGWGDVRDVNGASIGIELVNPGHDWGLRAFAAAQSAALIDMLTDLQARWRIPPEAVIGHSDCAPSRKIDPGESFPWRALAEAGVSIWPDATPPEGARLGAAAIPRAHAALAAHGWPVTTATAATAATDARDAAFWAALAAFRQRFRAAPPPDSAQTMGLYAGDLTILEALATRWPWLRMIPDR